MDDMVFDYLSDYDIFDQPEIGNEFFPGYEKDTRRKLYDVTLIVDYLASQVEITKCILSVIGIILNFLHLVVLTRKSMRNNSINIILTSLAIHDILAMLITIYICYLNNVQSEGELFCTIPDVVYNSASELFSDLLKSLIRRSSSWIAIMMATIRVISIKNYENAKYSSMATLKFGIYVSIFEIVFCSIFSVPSVFPIFQNGLYRNFDEDKWKPEEICAEIPTDFHFGMQVAYSLEDAKRNYVIDGVTINLIPSILYPILTFILIKELKKAKKQVSNKRGSHGRDSKSDRVTYIVIWMTIFFIIAELPQAFADFVLPAFLKTPGFLWLGNNIKVLFSVLSLMNGTIHCLICFGLSSTYRKTVYELLTIKKKNKISLGPLRSTKIIHSSTNEI